MPHHQIENLNFWDGKRSKVWQNLSDFYPTMQQSGFLRYTLFPHNPWLPSYLFDACFVRVVEGASLHVFRDQLGPNLRNLMPVHQGFQGCKVIGWLAVSCIIQIHGSRTCKWVAGGVKSFNWGMQVESPHVWLHTRVHNLRQKGDCVFQTYSVIFHY